ncbi:Protein lin-9 [Orchesella cincta]|uniref:Protein lin-9 n=1 Tax=Orchesella cincta TaxID=48709 RepID=A0A1D2M3R9_ORCCI|nr:Protein lin-9 [Orchesella cincta]
MNPPLKSKQQQVAKRSCPARFKQNVTPATPPKPVVADIEKKPEVIPTPPPPALALPAPPPQRASGAARFMLAGSTPTLTYNPLQLPILNAVQQQELIAENYNQRHGGLMDLSHRVRNFLKLPKSHKWVCYEWFYSTIDQVLFKAENDFQMCLRESFPALKTRKLTRIEWTTIRRIMGKPRRCSSAFLTEEQRASDEIPLQLVIGTKVTARLRIPQDGLFEGRIEGVDTSNSTYRISFQRSRVGVHSVRDFEVSSNEPVETVSTSSFVLKIPRRLVGEKLTLSKLLKKKRIKIAELRELNVEAEKMTSYGKPYNQAFKLEYARDMGELNKVIGKYMAGVQAYCVEIPSDSQHSTATAGATNTQASKMINSEQVLERCRQDASMMLFNFNDNKTAPGVKNPKILELIRNAATMMLGIRRIQSLIRVPSSETHSGIFKNTVKANVEGKNLRLYEDRVEMVMNRMIAGLCVKKDSDMM